MHKSPRLTKLPFAIALLLILAQACTPAPTTWTAAILAANQLAPTPTPQPGVEADFGDITLDETDAENFEKRLEDLTSGLVRLDSDVERTVLIDAYKELAKYKPTGGRWTGIGPAPINGVYLPQGQIESAGMVNSFAIDPRDSNVVYAAGSFGGLWKTQDGGKTWRSLTDRQVPMVYGGIEMDPKDPNTLYALLGEFSPTLLKEYGYLANGIMRTRDGGRTWKLIGADAFKGAVVTALTFDSRGNLYAASGLQLPIKAPPGRAEFGIYKSADRGDTWDSLTTCAEDCKPAPSVEQSGGFIDVAVASDDTLYASECFMICEGSKLLRSRDGGATWDELDFSSALDDFTQSKKTKPAKARGSDLPNVTGLKLAVAAKDPDLLLAGGGVDLQAKGDATKPASFAMRSRDGGDTWEWLPKAADYCTGTGSNMQCAYDNIVEIDPTDSDIMYLGGSFMRDSKTKNWHGVIQRSADGGDTWRDLTPHDSQQSWMHPDSHGLRIDPRNHDVVYVGTDGGMYRTKDASKAKPVWEHLHNGVNTLLFVSIGLHPTDRNYIIGGLQDNGVVYTTDGGKTWPGASQGDAGYSAVDPFNPDIVYSTWPLGGFKRNEVGGEGNMDTWELKADGLDDSDRWLFYPPFVVDRQNEGVIYLASNRVYKTEDRGDNWEPISPFMSATGSVNTLAMAPSDPDVLYAGLTSGMVWTTTDGGKTWKKASAKLLPTRSLNRLAVDPKDPKTVYAVYGGFNAQTPAGKGHVFRTQDGGKTWQDISLNLPDAPLGAVVVDARPKYAGVYVGGALGMWVLKAGATQWLPYGTGMPYALVTDIQLNPKTGIMAVATYGRSVWVMEMP